MEAGKQYSLITALLDFFGKHPNQTTGEFAQEMKALTERDRDELRTDLKAKGYNIA